MFSNVVCIGDSYTNEHEQYRAAGVNFDDLDYEFKSYPQVLGEYYDCKWETFGKPGMPMPYTLQTLIDRIDYIQKMENPLVIYQFGFFDNVILGQDIGNYTDWKSLSNNHTDILQHTNFSVINKHTDFNPSKMSKLEKVGMMAFLEKYGALTNFHYIEQFLTIAKLLNRTSNTSIYGLFMAEIPKFKFPTHKNILFMGKHGDALSEKESLNLIFPQIDDSHKTTLANTQIAEEIIEILKMKELYPPITSIL